MASKKGKSSKTSLKSTAHPVEIPAIIEELVEVECIMRDIHIMVEGFEHLKCKYNATDVFVQAEFLGIVIGESPQQAITHDFFIPHNFHCVLRFDINNPKCIDDLVSNPLVFNVFQAETIYDVSQIAKALVDIEEDIIDDLITTVKQKDHKSGSKKEEAKPLQPDTFIPQAVGRCNLDLLSVLLGETEIVETLPIEQETMSLEEDMVTFETLPRLKVHILTDDVLLEPDDIKSVNVLSFSPQAIFNPTPEMSDAMYYTLGILVPTSGENMAPIIIEDGITVHRVSEENAKMWPGLASLQNRAAYSEYKFEKDFRSIKNHLNVDIKNILESQVPRIEWNIIRRCWMPELALDSFANRLKKYRNWPFELHGTLVKKVDDLMVPPPESDSNVLIVTPSPPRPLPQVQLSDVHFMGFLDITKMLYPGITKTTVMCQLQTYHAGEMLTMAGIEHQIFEIGELPKPPTKGSAKPASKKGAAPPVVEPPPEDLGSVHIFSEDGKPTFIVMEVEVRTSLLPKRKIEDLTTSIRKLIPERPSLPKHIVNSRMTEKHLRLCIQEIVEYLHTDFHKYSQSKNSINCPQYMIGNDERDFNKFLKESGNYDIFKNTLQKKIMIIISDRFPFKGDTKNRSHVDEYINEIYVYLIKEINQVVHSLLGPSIDFSDKQIGPSIQSKDLLYYAKEAEELGDMDLAQQYYLQRIQSDDCNPNFWLDYAIFNLTLHKFDKAFECCTECVTLNIEHKYGILFYALLLTKKAFYKEAELCFLALLSHYPNFVAGWISFHLFYLRQENYEGSDVAFEMGYKCLGLMDEETIYKDPFISYPELGWETQIWKPEQLYAQTAVLLIKLRCFEFVEMALAQDLLFTPNSTCYSYYFAVSFYLTERYTDALEYLEMALKIHGHDIPVGGLLGHCNFKLKNFNIAGECYEPLLYGYQRPDDLHIIYLRLGFWYRDQKKPEEALKMFLLACRYSPTPKTWLEAGITFEIIGNLESAEECLTEANTLDNKLPEVWGFLALINLKMKRIIEAEECYKYAAFTKHKMDNQSTDSMDLPRSTGSTILEEG